MLTNTTDFELEPDAINVVVVGQGAIGLLYYKFLADSSLVNVSLLSSGALTRQNSPTHKASIKEAAKNTARININTLVYKNSTGISINKRSLRNVLNGERFEDKDKNQQLTLAHATKTEIAAADMVLICVKSYQVEQALKDIDPYLSAKSVVTLSHNGMGAYQTLSEETKQRNTFLMMLTTHGCKKEPSVNGQYVINHTGAGKTDIGLLSADFKNTLEQANLNKLLTQLNNATWQENITTALWTKLAINCVINPITAINDIDNGEILKQDYQSDITTIVNEVVDVARAESVELSSQNLLKTVKDVAEKTAKNSSSMRCDVIANRATEIDFINGYIHRLGLAHNISTPMNTLLCQQVKALNVKP